MFENTNQTPPYLLKKKKKTYIIEPKNKKTRTESSLSWVNKIQAGFLSKKKKKNPSGPELSADYDKPRSITCSPLNAVVLKTHFTVNLEGILYLVSHQTKNPLCFLFSHQTPKRHSTDVVLVPASGTNGNYLPISLPSLYTCIIVLVQWLSSLKFSIDPNLAKRLFKKKKKCDNQKTWFWNFCSFLDFVNNVRNVNKTQLGKKM